LGIALVMTAVCVLSHRWLRLLSATRHAEPDPHWTAALTTFAGLLLGVFVTLSSVGAGAIGMTALVLLYPRTPIARLVGSDIAHAVPLTLIAGVGHWLLGSVDSVLLSSLAIGSLPGIFFGSQLSARVPDKVLRPVLAAILVIVGSGFPGGVEEGCLWAQASPSATSCNGRPTDSQARSNRAENSVSADRANAEPSLMSLTSGERRPRPHMKAS
jgi:hypothetical protein